VLVKDESTKLRMAETYRQARWEQYHIEQTRLPEYRHAQGVHAPEALLGFKDAPVLIVVCGDRRTYQASLLAGSFIGGEGGGLNTSYMKNIANAIYGIHLAAHALGLGSQWVSVNAEWEQYLKQLLDVPAVLLIHAVVPIGYAAYVPPTPYRRDIVEIVHHERYDRARFRSGEQISQYLRELKGRTKSAYDKERSPREK
jgi:nitroreductase